ncbi:MAG TPA: hypothetical protein VEK38_03195 [Candidatus Bathyarchaeia archaeon]|nr:hypothetical protein [Candidatus Bathyarchaeia archaeon]
MKQLFSFFLAATITTAMQPMMLQRLIKTQQPKHVLNTFIGRNRLPAVNVVHKIEHKKNARKKVHPSCQKYFCSVPQPTISPENANSEELAKSISIDDKNSSIKTHIALSGTAFLLGSALIAADLLVGSNIISHASHQMLHTATAHLNPHWFFYQGVFPILNILLKNGLLKQALNVGPTVSAAGFAYIGLENIITAATKNDPHLFFAGNLEIIIASIATHIHGKEFFGPIYRWMEEEKRKEAQAKNSAKQ